MSKFSCKCPAPGCKKVFVAEASDWERAFQKIFVIGNRHVVECHPDLPEVVDDRNKAAREYAQAEMKMVEK